MPYDYSSNSYASVDRTHSSGTTEWNITMSDKKDNSLLDPSEFLNLMVAQLQNQDFMNPMDNTEYVTQMAQFSSIQAMDQLASYSKNSYAMSLIGKDVTASKFKFNGDLDTETGPVQKISLVNNEYILYVNGKKYSLDQIMEVQRGLEPGECLVDPSGLKPTYSELTSDSVKVSWKLPTEDTSVSSKLTYNVYYSTEGPFNTVEEVENGTETGITVKGAADESLLTGEISGLEPGEHYYINIVVTDASGNKAVYKPLQVSTRHS